MPVMPAAFNFDVFPALKTERLLLREITLADAPAVFRVRGDYQVTRHNIGAAYADVPEARRLIEAMRRGYHEQTEVRWGVTLKGDSAVIGMCGFNHWHRGDRRGGVGYDLARAFWGRGLMREAVRAIVAFGFERMHLHRVEADVGAGNRASIKLLEALGFACEGVQREQYWEEDAFHDLRLYGLLRRDWQG